MAELLADIIFNAGKLKRFDILAYQIMLGHAHLLVWGQYERATDRTLENARSVLGDKHSNASESTLSRVRPDKKNAIGPSIYHFRFEAIHQRQFFPKNSHGQYLAKTILHQNCEYPEIFGNGCPIHPTQSVQGGIAGEIL